MRHISDRENTKKITQDALKQYRLTRDKVETDHPGLLHSIKEQVIEATQPEVVGVGDCSIDGEKNLEIAMRFMEMSSSSPFIQAELNKILKSRVH